MGRALLIFTMVGTFCLNGLLPAVFCKAQAQETGAIAVDALQCEYAANPLGIDAPQPRFTWTLKSLQRGQVQTAYQVVVARTEQTLHGDAGDMWDSGKVTSDRSVNVVYDGKPLSSGEKCWWKVRVWDKAGRPSGWSEPATFEMGLLNESDWQGQWITIADNTAPLLRKEIVIDKAVRSARVYFAGLGFSELYVNGEKVGDDVLSPALTDYFEQIQYMTYDLTDVLKPTANALGVMLGNGYFSAPLTDWKNPWGDRPQLLLQLNIQYADGTQASIVSDTSWKAARAPIEGNSIDYGEVYDARKERPGWCAAGYDDADWQPAVEGKSPGGRLTSQTMPAMRVIETIKPIRLTNPQPAVYVYEFDRLFGGWARLHVKGPAGGQVRIAYSTRLLATGLIDKEPWPGDQVTDFYTLKGDPAGEFYEPRFTFHPVQYVQITGLPGTPTLDDLEGRCVYTAEDMSGTFECSNPLFNRIHSNMIRTLQNALKGFLLDCMHREPIGYNEPASMSASLFTRKHMPRFWTKFAEDSRLAVAPDGSVSDIAPIFPGAAGRQPDVAQSVSYPMMIRYLYQCYDDRRLLENHYPAIKRWTDYIGREMCEGPIVVKGWLGDHMLPGNAPGYEKWLSDETPPSLIWTALYYRNLQITSEMAGVLGKTSDAREYAVLAERVKRAFNDTWLDAATSHYGSKSQTSEILPLALGPANQLVSEISGLCGSIRAACVLGRGGNV